MRVKVTYLGPFERFAGKREDSFELKTGCTARDLVSKVSGEFAPENVRFLKGALIARDGRMIPHDTGLREGDDIIFMSPVIGGG